MNVLYLFALLLSCACVQAWYGKEPKFLTDRFDYEYRLAQKMREQKQLEEQERQYGRTRRVHIQLETMGKSSGLSGIPQRGDSTCVHHTGRGVVRSDFEAVKGTGAYEHTFTNGDGGRLAAQAYGTRVLNPNRDSTYYGGKLDWSDSNMHASADARQRIGGRARMDLEAGGRWEPFKNSEVTAGGFYSKREGRPSDYGGALNFRYNGW